MREANPEKDAPPPEVPFEKRCQCESCKATGAVGPEKPFLGYHRWCRNEGVHPIMVRTMNTETLQYEEKERRYCDACYAEATR